eukprot:GHVS01082068.1.p1 GENE.GHVS01082068.1~~GHVS01082068.1.p1  ORF type:complete len:378 (+),score=53.31 GHVS01082068.1:74-1207(+)
MMICCYSFLLLLCHLCTVLRYAVCSDKFLSPESSSGHQNGAGSTLGRRLGEEISNITKRQELVGKVIDDATSQINPVVAAKSFIDGMGRALKDDGSSALYFFGMDGTFSERWMNRLAAQKVGRWMATVVEVGKAITEKGIVELLKDTADLYASKTSEGLAALAWVLAAGGRGSIVISSSRDIGDFENRSPWDVLGTNEIEAFHFDEETYNTKFSYDATKEDYQTYYRALFVFMLQNKWKAMGFAAATDEFEKRVAYLKDYRNKFLLVSSGPEKLYPFNGPKLDTDPTNSKYKKAALVLNAYEMVRHLELRRCVVFDDEDELVQGLLNSADVNKLKAFVVQSGVTKYKAIYTDRRLTRRLQDGRFRWDTTRAPAIVHA